MRLNGKHINISRRKDAGPTEMKVENMVVSSTRNDDGTYSLDISDRANPEFYIKLQISADELTDSKKVTPSP